MFDKTAAQWTAWLDDFTAQAEEALALIEADEDDNVPMVFA